MEYRSVFHEQVYFADAEFLVPLEPEILEVIYLFNDILTAFPKYQCIMVNDIISLQWKKTFKNWSLKN